MLPGGYERLLLPHAVAVARTDIVQPLRRSLLKGDGSARTLYDYAARHSGARRLRGRGAAYAVPLPDTDVRVVVRHNRHGGTLAFLTGDRFLAPTRAPRELHASLELAKHGIPTPEIIAYVLYPPGGLLQRSDVCSREIPGGRDLADIISLAGPAERGEALSAAAALVARLSRAGARHADLNAMNVLVAPSATYVLDVDRVSFGRRPESALEDNVARLARSLRKCRDVLHARVTEVEIGELAISAREAFARGRENP